MKNVTLQPDNNNLSDIINEGKSSDTLSREMFEVAEPATQTSLSDGLPTGTFGQINLADFRIDQESFADSQARQITTIIPVRKPPKTAFFRVHPFLDYRMQAGIITHENTGEHYLVVGALCEDLLGEAAFSSCLIVTAVTRQGTLFLWPLKATSDNSWSRSAREAVEIATREWIRLRSDRELGAYVPMAARNQASEPVWPAMKFPEILAIAFRGKIISDHNHPILRELRGE